jgi:AcrR family transcriptional regulator
MAAKAGKAGRRRLEPSERRRELLDQALIEFSTRPYDEVTTAAIAARAGASEGLIFRYFGDKRSLYIEAIRTAMTRAREVTDVTDPERSPTERFELGLARLVDLVERFPFAIPLTLQGGHAADPELQAVVAEGRDTLIDRIIGRMGVERPSEQLRAAVRIWIVFVQVSTAEWLASAEIPREELLRSQIAVFRASVAEVLGVEPRPTPPGGPPPLLP